MADKEVVDSLKQISGNLEAINYTLSEANHEDKPISNTEKWKEQIEKLIKKVDCECKKISSIRLRKIAIGIFLATFIAIILLLGYLDVNTGIAILSYAKSLPSEQVGNFLVQQIAPYAAISISVVAIIFSFPFEFLRPSSVGELSEHYYNLLSKDPDISSNDKPYLKALIKMKCKEFDLKLEEIYNLNSDLFTRKNLLKNLYE